MATSEPASASTATRRGRRLRLVGVSALAVGFVLLGGGGLDLGLTESRLGLAAGERMGPLGQTFGGWEPTVWPGRLAPSLAWSWGEGGWPSSASVRWPAAIAAVLVGLILSRRVARALGDRAGALVALCWLGCLGVIDRSVGGGLDLITGLATVAALDRLIGRGSDLVAGTWVALAFLTGGWPPVALIALATVVLGRHGATLSAALLAPPFLAAVGWSAWALKAAPAEAWGAALALPLTQPMAWWLVPGVLGLALPWTPLAVLAASRSVRAGWSDAGRSLVLGWSQTAGVCLIAGTLIPGLANAAMVPALAGLAIASGAGIDPFLAGAATGTGTGRRARGWLIGVALVMVTGWAVLAGLAGGYLAAAVPYYRALWVGLIAACVPMLGLAVRSVARRDAHLALLAVFALAVCLKVAHWGYYVPEWNYRASQGPWGRAIGQWVPPRWPIYTTHAWPADLAFATEHPFRQLASERHLEYQPGTVRFVLLLRSEFENWPEQAPRIEKVADFQDEYGQERVLARTLGDLPWVTAAKARGYVADDE